MNPQGNTLGASAGTVGGHDLFIGSAVVVAVLLALALLWDVRRDIRRLISGRNVVLAGIAAWFLLEALMLSDELRKYPQSVYDYSVMCVALAAVGFLAGYHKTRGAGAIDKLARRFRTLDDHRLLWYVVLTCGVIGFAPILYYAEGNVVKLIDDILGMRKTWGGILARGRYGGLREALLMLEMFIKGAGPFAVILLIDRRSNFFQRVVCLIIAVWPLLRAYGSGTRSSMLTSLLPALAVIYLMLRPQTQRRVIIAMLLASPAIYLFMAAMVVSRGTGEFSLDSAQHAKYVGNEMFQELAFITDNVPDKIGYLWGQSYFVQIVNPIPRFLWPGKPRLDTGIMMAQLKGEVDKRSGETYLTRSPGLIGEMYFNFGLPGIALLSFFGGWLVRGWDNMAQRYGSSLPTMILYYMGLATLFIMGRSFNMEMLYGIIFLMVGVWLVTKLMGIEPAPVSAAAMPQPSNPSPARPSDLARSPVRLPRKRLPRRGRSQLPPPAGEGASE